MSSEDLQIIILEMANCRAERTESWDSAGGGGARLVAEHKWVTFDFVMFKVTLRPSK